MKKIFWLGLACIACFGCSRPNSSTLTSTPVDSILPAQLQSTLFQWSNEKGLPTQTAYQILVASSTSLIEQGIGDVWDSGIRADSSTSLVAYCQSDHRQNYWSVRTWHGSDSASSYRSSQVATLPSTRPSMRIVFLGGTTIAHMDDYPSLELALTNYWKAPNVTFRNIGWPADDVFGLARSQFGSAQNTRSWQPPSAEEGYGSEVMQQHLLDADPDLILLYYGAETGFHSTADEFSVFKRGYRDLLDYIKSLDSEVILLTPLAHVNNPQGPIELAQVNENLSRTTDFIKQMAAERDLAVIDLFSKFEDPIAFAENGYQLNQRGHQLLAKTITSQLGIAQAGKPRLVMDGGGFPETTENLSLTDWTRTVKGVRFNLQTAGADWRLEFDNPNSTKLNNLSMSGDQVVGQLLQLDSLRIKHLEDAIITKNKYYRYRLRPLNEAYIFLFRRHEMGHLAGELDQYNELLGEEELRIASLLGQGQHRLEIELNRSWKSPRDYPEDEVPANVPAPDIREELAAFDLAPGLSINLFASDPMIMNPINVNWDLRGRAWVATSSTYPHILPGKEPNDKIIILEDTDSDGRADKHTVFAENLLVPQSVMPVKGGAYVCSSTEFLFLADTNNDDRADIRKIVYDGFGNADVHHMIHGLRWAPWGDLYFTQSIYINSFVETPFGLRVLNGSGTWQFRPETQRLEIYSRGLINPWGHAIDRYGQSFATDGAGSSGITYIYPATAHATAVGVERILPGLNEGTPKNTGAEVISSRHLPPSWQGSIVTSDFRRNRTVRYALERYGSSYKSTEVQTIVHSDHRSFRPVDMKVGPDGALYIVDWYNPIIDHGEVDFHHPLRDHTHGRIWRITANKKQALRKIDFSSLSERGLLDQLKSSEQLSRIQANRALVQRQIEPSDVAAWIASHPAGSAQDHHVLEGLWLSVALNAPNEQALQRCLNSKDPRIRAAATRMINYFSELDKYPTLEKAIRDTDAQVRLEAINALRNIGTLESVSLASTVLEDTLDTDLDYMLWLTFRETDKTWLSNLRSNRSLLDDDPIRILFALRASSDPDANVLLSQMVNEDYFSGDLREKAIFHLAREGKEAELGMVLEEAVMTKNADLMLALASSSGSDELVANKGELYSLLEVEDSLLQISVSKLIGSWKVAFNPAPLLSVLTGSKTVTDAKMAAAQALANLGEIDELAKLAQSSHSEEIRTICTSEWAKLAPTPAADAIISLLSSLEDKNKLQLLYRSYLRQEEGPSILAAALTGSSIPEDNAIAGLQLCRAAGRDFSELIAALEEAGSVEAVGTTMSESDKQALLKEVAEKGNPNRGRLVYRNPQLQCGSCHYLGGIGGKLGPDLTTVGSYMTPGSILESLLNPGRDIKQGYETILVTKTDGTVVGGVLERKTSSATLLRDATNKIKTIPNSEIESMDVSPISLMPAGLTAKLRRDEMVDLLAFLTTLGRDDVEN